MLARVLLLQERDEEAAELVALCGRVAPASQLDAHIRWRGIKAVLLARQGAQAAARELASEAVRLARRSQQLDTQATALMDQAETLRLSDRPGEARTAAQQALACHERKGNLIGAASVTSFLAAIEEIS
jgi:hypothetical protein